MPEIGLVTIASNHRVKDTIDRLVGILTAQGVTVFARIDHAAGALSVGMPLRPTELLIFGNPKAGTPLMQSRQTVGIDLPLKALAWQDEAGRNWLSYYDIEWLARRYQLHADATQAIAALTQTMAGLAKRAAS